MDDYHMIASDAIHQALTRMMRYFPPKIHVVIISRHKLPRFLSRFKCQCDMVEITADDLKFTADETRDFFEKVIPLDLTERPHTSAYLYRRRVGYRVQIFGLSQMARKLPIDPKTSPKRPEEK